MVNKKNNDAKSVRTMRDLSVYCNEWGLNLSETGIPAVENVVKDEEVVSAMKKYGIHGPLEVTLCRADAESEYVSIFGVDGEDMPVEIPFLAEMPVEKFGEKLLEVIEDAVSLHYMHLHIRMLEGTVDALEKLGEYIRTACENTPLHCGTREWFATLMEEIEREKESIVGSLQGWDQTKFRKVKEICCILKNF